jgi:hypothetical protein
MHRSGAGRKESKLPRVAKSASPTQTLGARPKSTRKADLSRLLRSTPDSFRTTEQSAWILSALDDVETPSVEEEEDGCVAGAGRGDIVVFKTPSDFAIVRCCDRYVRVVGDTTANQCRIVFVCYG